MALDYQVTYSAGFLPGDANYPNGIPKNSTTETSEDGAPWDVLGIKDWHGFFQGLLALANISPSGNPDTVNVSQYIQGLRNVDIGTYATLSILKSTNVVRNSLARTQGYAGGWAALSEPQGGALYVISTLQEIRDGLSDPGFIPDEKRDHTMGNSLVAYMLSDGVVNFLQVGGSISASDNTSAWNAALDRIKVTGEQFLVKDVFPFTQTAHIPGGKYSINMTGGKILSAAAVVSGVTIGDQGSTIFSGDIVGLNVQKSVRNVGLVDYGITYINVAEAYFSSPEQRNFDIGHYYKPGTGSRVAYNTINNILSFNSVFDIKIEPQNDNSFVTENTWVGGRCHATTAGVLNSHIYLTDLSTGKDKVEHNRFYGVSIEGFSGGGTSGNRAVWCQHGSHNLFHWCRTEEYNTGWSVSPYHFENASQHNDVVDLRFETRIQDDSTGNGQSFRTSSDGMLINKRSGSGETPALEVRRNSNADGSIAALKVIDTATGAPGIALLSLESKSNVFSVRTEEVFTITTATGKVLTIDDQGSLLPLSTNKGHLGNSGQRWKELFTNLDQYADDTAAGVGGLVTGQAYRDANNKITVKF